MVTILTNTISDVAESGYLLPGQQLSLPVQMEGKIGRLLVLVQGFEELTPVRHSRRMHKLAPKELERACAAMRDQLAEPVRLRTIASLIGLSPWQFSRSFHATAGVKFSSYLLRLRLDSAMRLMLDSKKTLYEIAMASGFGDQSSFSRVFVRKQGVTPMKWRHLNSR
jgi:transcriptional regulator GlxA family with amidase domain